MGEDQTGAFSSHSLKPMGEIVILCLEIIFQRLMLILIRDAGIVE